jgi:uncharacterized protein
VRWQKRKSAAIALRQEKARKAMTLHVRGALILSTIIGMSCLISSAQTPQTAQTTVAGASDQGPVSTIPVEQRATKEQLARLFEVMRVKQQMDSVLKMMPAMVEKQMQEQVKAIRAQIPGSAEMSPKEQEAMEQFQRRIMEKALSAYPYEEMISDMTDVYQRHVTRADADAFIAFYSSPAGQRLLDEQPAIMKEYMPMVMKRMSERSKDLADEIVKEAAEMAKKFGTTSKTTSTPK